MRRGMAMGLAVVFLAAALAEPMLALQQHACCLARPAATAEHASCHEDSGTPSDSFSAIRSAQPECPSRCCISTARQAARPEPSPSPAAAPQVVANARASGFQPLSQAELPAPSGRAPPSSR